MPRVLLLVAIGLLASGCARFRRLDQDLANVQGMWVLRGEVVGAPARSVVYALRVNEARPEVLDRAVAVNGRFEFRVEPHWRILLVAFDDRNGDLRHQPHERSGRLPSPIDFSQLEAPNHVLDGLRIELVDAGDETLEQAAPLDGARRGFRIGEIASLDDARFDEGVAQLGVWEPLRFLLVHGAGIYLLEPYDPSRVPVVFIHGLGGSPREFRSLARTLPRAYQPVFVHYPSGWDLRETTRYLERFSTEFAAMHRIPRMCVVGHSMGGLIARAWVQMHSSDVRLASLITVASPLAGVSSAAQGVQHAPVVVPSWRNLVPGSPFLRELVAPPLPEGTRYALVFTHSDSVVNAAAQLPRALQNDADRMFGSEHSHVGVLESEALAEFVREELLEGCPALPAR